jgi:hypothetical protein
MSGFLACLAELMGGNGCSRRKGVIKEKPITTS